MLRSATLALILATAHVSAQDRTAEHQTRIDAWAGPLAETLVTLLPDPIDGLDSWAPWDSEFREPALWGCPLGCAVFTRIAVQRPYVVAEPDLPAKVEAAAQKALANAMKIAAAPTDRALQAAQKALEDEEERLKRSVRRLTLEIRINDGPPAPRGQESAPTRAGTVGGHAVHRFAFSDASYEPTPSGVRLAVALGPETFNNPKAKDVSEMKTEARSVTVSVSVQSRAATVNADEALARKLLERIGWGQLAKLMQP